MLQVGKDLEEAVEYAAQQRHYLGQRIEVTEGTCKAHARALEEMDELVTYINKQEGNQQLNRDGNIG